MNITQSVYDRNCPACGSSVRDQLKRLASSTECGYRERGTIECSCGRELKVYFEWGVVWSEIELSDDAAELAVEADAAPLRDDCDPALADYEHIKDQHANWPRG